jgi:hypothetical protein
MADSWLAHAAGTRGVLTPVNGEDRLSAHIPPRPAKRRGMEMTAATEDAVWDALRTVDDPEVGVNVVDLGLVYGVEVRGDEVSGSAARPPAQTSVRNGSAAVR